MASKKKLPKVGRCIGSGCAKVCYALSKTKVALIADDYHLNYDLRALNRLRKLGIPVASFKKGKVLSEYGEVVPALIGERYNFHTFDFSDRRITKKQKVWLRKIRRAIAKAGVEMNDIQFLGKRTGKVVVTDPGYIRKVSKSGYNDSLELLDDILGDAPVDNDTAF